ncbi:MAG: RNA-binding S4 domain-containing protein [Candidatus Gastranaerophilales bacterium]|nr:RNA-binding S4 domain-containing protein [Candidatus Gastranaerophilales bacterium]
MMRLDKFLKVSRLIKRRTVANEVSDQGRIFINDKPAKPSKEVKEGDKISIEYYNKTLVVEVLKVPSSNVSIQESKDLYKVIEEIQQALK